MTSTPEENISEASQASPKEVKSSQGTADRDNLAIQAGSSLTQKSSAEENIVEFRTENPEKFKEIIGCCGVGERSFKDKNPGVSKEFVELVDSAQLTSEQGKSVYDTLNSIAQSNLKEQKNSALVQEKATQTEMKSRFGDQLDKVLGEADKHINKLALPESSKELLNEQMKNSPNILGEFIKLSNTSFNSDGNPIGTNDQSINKNSDVLENIRQAILARKQIGIT